MPYLNFESEYNKYPETAVDGFDNEAFSGWDEIGRTLASAYSKSNILTVDCYPGTDDTEILDNLIPLLKPDLIIKTEDIFFDGDKLTELMKFNLTDDRVRGIMYYGTVADFIDGEKLEEAKRKVENFSGKVLIYGFAASIVSSAGSLVYADMARWEIQLRYRKGMPNFKQKNFDEDDLRKYKRGFFIEWRIADRHKAGLYDKIDFYLDTNTRLHPTMVSGDGLRAGLNLLCEQPFRLVPYFDPGVWGGQWMKEVCHLDKTKKNFAWSFDGVPEENSIFLRFGDVKIESPAMNLTLYRPTEFLGEKNYARFGAEFPIRFDFLDTMDGQNLSLQVHPTTEYIHKKFGMSYTQDESYYILDAKEDGGVYLGLKEGVDKAQMFADLTDAQDGKMKFDAEKYVNFFPAKKHNHFLIPAGTVHCSSKNCMVLEVSATPYIFTFKLWDWDRLGLDGKPRPIHIEDGRQVIRFDRTTNWVKNNLVNRFEPLCENNDYSAVKTGLHALEFIETIVYTVKTEVLFESDGEMAMCNLVEGKLAVIKSKNGSFAPYTVHYAETFIIPANADDVIISNASGEGKIKVLKANVRN